MEEGIISESKSRVRKIESDEEDSGFKCFDKSKGKPVHVEVNKLTIEGNKSTLALLQNRSEKDEITNNGETRGGDGKINSRRSNRKFKSLERFGSLPYF